MKAPHWRPVYVGLGSNLEQPVAQIEKAIDAIGAIDRCLVCRRSSLYRSAPMGPQDQPDFVNAVIALLTKLEPLALLDALQAIEAAQGRARGERWGPRTLDLDLLSYSREKSADDRLTLPHPGIAERNFVLLPWREIAPHYRVPGLSTVESLASLVPSNSPAIRRIE